MNKKKDYKVKRVNRELVYKGSILDIYADTMELDNGKKEKWDFVSHRMGAACVVPVLPNGDVLLVRQYRPALDRETIELPAGCRDSLTEDTYYTAKRELEEETGYSSDEISPLLKLKSTVAFCDEFIDVYLAENIFLNGEQNLDEEEEIDVEVYTREELEDLIYSGKIQDSKTVSGLLAYFNLCNKRNLVK
ncbi:NUDIX hydrolase [Lachnobacterium bovis]|uniref:ADP-ribose pyrophosphatase n=1 Tax=Lachnobacterium bovis TaxID=140626 RepID=A0A1H9TT85_9FIRM|nr:NUDIX hydrolase [Lachnobacterium bovis]SES00445.1 ADP-ribose pyrophosphatase [Lachnobacterium bovis]